MKFSEFCELYEDLDGDIVAIQNQLNQIETRIQTFERPLVQQRTRLQQTLLMKKKQKALEDSRKSRQTVDTSVNQTNTNQTQQGQT